MSVTLAQLEDVDERLEHLLGDNDELCRLKHKLADSNSYGLKSDLENLKSLLRNTLQAEGRLQKLGRPNVADLKRLDIDDALRELAAERSEISDLARHYAADSTLHATWITTKLVELLVWLESIVCLYESLALASNGTAAYFIKPWPRTFLASVWALIRLAILIVVLYALFSGGYSFFGGLLAVIASIVYFEKRQAGKEKAAKLSKTQEPIRTIHLLLRDVEQHCYEPAEVARRIRSLEKSGVYVHSIAFTLLQNKRLRHNLVQSVHD
ncbi:MAG TPA: hypothetical protein VD837_19210 [Terriglobales bacterium]|nr:hypothetical protein [Terriglobales bacterium]